MLAAVALGNLYFFNVSIFAPGTLMALDPLVAQAIGANDDGRGVARDAARSRCSRSDCSVLTALLLAPAAPMLRALHQPAEIVPDAARVPAHLDRRRRSRFSRSSCCGRASRPCIAWRRSCGRSCVANLPNAALNWVFVYGHLGSPALGVAGSAIATAISRWLMTILLLVFAWKDCGRTSCRCVATAGSGRRFDECSRSALPIGAQQALEAGAFGAIGLLMGVLGTIEMAAHQIAITLAALTFMVPLGVATRGGGARRSRDRRGRRRARARRRFARRTSAAWAS